MNTIYPNITPELPVRPTQAEYKAKDIELFNSWKSTGDKASLGALVKQLGPVIYSEVRRTSGTLPEAALSAESKKWAVKAIQTFDPSKGVALATHATNFLQKTRRLNYKYQNSARLPENLQLQFTTFKNAQSHLENTLGREPTDEELAKHLGWGKAVTVRLKNSLYEDLVESVVQRPSEITQFNENKLLMDHLMSKLDEQEKFLLLNSKEMSATDLAKKIGVNISRLNYLKSKLKDKILAIKAEIKMY